MAPLRIIPSAKQDITIYITTNTTDEDTLPSLMHSQALAKLNACKRCPKNDDAHYCNKKTVASRMNEKSLMLCASVTKGATVVGGKRRYERLEQPKVSSSLGASIFIGKLEWMNIIVDSKPRINQSNNQMVS